MVVPARVRDLLRTVDCDDLYEFLQLEPNAKPSKLQVAAQKEFDRIQNKGLRGPQWEARKDLAGLCASIFKNDDTKKDYDRALEDARKRGETGEQGKHTGGFDEATALLETGMGFIRQGTVKDAVVIAKRLPGDYAEYSTFRMTVAGLLMSRRMHIEAIDFLSWCEGEEPNNDHYKAILGTAFATVGTANWERVGGETYATRAEHVAEAAECLSRARAYSESSTLRDTDLQVAIAHLDANLEVATKRRWNGNKLAAIGGGLVGLGVAGSPDIIGGNSATLMLASTVAYVVSSVEPQWKINAAGLKQPQADGCLWYIAMAGLILLFLPFVAGWKFFTNFWPTYRHHSAVTSTREGFGKAIRRILASLGRGVLALAAVGLLAVAAAGVRPLVSMLVEPAIEPGDGGGAEPLPAGDEDQAEAAADESPPRRETPSSRPTVGDVVDARPADGNLAQAGPSAEAEGVPVVAQGEGGHEDSSTAMPAPVHAPIGGGELVPEQPESTTDAGPQRPVRVGGNVTAPTKVHDVQPVYPATARRMRVEGVVVLETVLGATGSVEQVRVLRSVRLLDDAAVAAVRQWRYTPTLLNGVPVPVVMSVTVNFTLQ